MPKLPKILVIVGPTGSGKTDIALRLAKEYNGEIIAADSRTIYKEMNIGTAKPPKDVQEGSRIHDLFGHAPYMVEQVAHWGFDLIAPNESYDVSAYAQFARAKIKDIVSRGKLPIVVGGSGLYVQAIVDNPTFSDVKPNPERREELYVMSLEALQRHLAKIDPEAYELIDIQNPRRLVRAIEVVETTGKPWAMQQQKNNPYIEALQIGIEIEREELYERLDARVDKMIAQGLVNEVRALLEKYGEGVPGMTGIGYRQIVAFLQGKVKLRDAITQLKQDTRQYAKRQMTWFKRDTRIVWIPAHASSEEMNRVFETVSEYIE